jgi:hypothetical protein
VARGAVVSNSIGTSSLDGTVVDQDAFAPANNPSGVAVDGRRVYRRRSGCTGAGALPAGPCLSSIRLPSSLRAAVVGARWQASLKSRIRVSQS